MSSELLSRTLDLLRRHKVLIWLGLGLSLSTLFGTGWRVWLSQAFSLDFARLADVQTIENLLFSSEIAKVQQLLLRGLLLGFGQFVLVWLVALGAEAGLISAVYDNSSQPLTLRRCVRWGQQWLGRFLAIDLLVFFPWFLVALLMLGVLLILALVLAGFATTEIGAGPIFATTGLGVSCLLLLGGLLVPIGLASFWFRLLAFREAVLSELSPRTAVRQTWRRIRQNAGEIIVLIILLWGGQAVVLGVLNLVTSPILTWLSQLTASDTIALRGAAWAVTATVTVLLWFVRGYILAFVAVAWTLAYKNLPTIQEEEE